MGSIPRTIVAGICVLAICFLLSASSWLQVLLLFVTASLGWSLWSSFCEREKAHKQKRIKRMESRNLPVDPDAVRVTKMGNVYHLPVQNWQRTSFLDMGGSAE